MMSSQAGVAVIPVARSDERRLYRGCWIKPAITIAFSFVFLAMTLSGITNVTWEFTRAGRKSPLHDMFELCGKYHWEGIWRDGD